MIKFLLGIILFTSTSAYADYEPWITDEYFFYREGEVREYVFTPERFARPEIVIFDRGCELPKDLFTANKDGTKVDKLDWKVLIEVFQGKKLLERQDLKLRAGWIEKGRCYKSLSFNLLKSLSWKVFPKEVKVRLTVTGIDERYSQKNQSLSFGIRQTPVP